MYQIETYTRQNKIQKEVMEILKLFRVEGGTQNFLSNKGVGLYTPKKIKVLRGVAVVLVVGSLFIPFTTTPLIPFLRKVVLR